MCVCLPLYRFCGWRACAWRKHGLWVSVNHKKQWSHCEARMYKSWWECAKKKKTTKLDSGVTRTIQTHIWVTPHWHKVLMIWNLFRGSDAVKIYWYAASHPCKYEYPSEPGGWSNDLWSTQGSNTRRHPSKRSNFCFIEINNNNHFKRTHKFNYRNFYCGENEIHFTFLRFVSPEIYSPTLSASLNRLVSVDAQANTDCIESRYRFFVLAPARQRHQLECDWQWSENKEMRIESRQLQPFACKIYIKFSHKNVHYSESAEPIISTCACPLPTAY